ncbi:FkbM family methyltransferase [Spirosoma harenae]
MFGKTEYQSFFERLYRISLIGMNIGNGASPEESGEKFVVNYVHKKTLLNKELVIFDVGANVGHYSKILNSVFGPRANIYAFEPSKKTFQTFLNNIENSTNVHPYNIGFSAKPQEMCLYSDKDSSALSSVYKRRLDHFDIDLTYSEKIALDTIDDFCKENHIHKVDFLKIDVEGHEIDVLQGASNMLTNKKITYIQFEFGGCNIDSKTYFQDFYYLLNKNYHIYRILTDGLYPIDRYEEFCESFITTNYFAELRA